jgi:nicotinate-nucleotide adenylyltransferase
MKSGILGGTFDPIHLGHLAVAEEARRRLIMDEVVFVPAGHPYFKAYAYITPAEHRVNMLNLAIADKPNFKISLMEIRRPGPSYAIDTVAKMKRQLGPGDEIFFIMGWDSLLALPQWQEPERLIKLCRIVAAPRPGYAEPNIGILENDLPGISQRTVVMDQPRVDISATDVRERVRKGLPIDKMVPPAVAKYIKEKGLYKGQRLRHPGF